MIKDRAWSISALTNYEQCPKKFYHLTIKKDFKDSFGAAGEYGKYVHKCLENLVKKGKPLPLDIEHMLPYVQPFLDIMKKGANVEAEQQLAITKDYEPDEWFGKAVWCRAILDLAIVGKKSATLIDYKTGKIKDDGFSQLRLCAAILSLFKPEIEVFNLAYLWTAHEGKLTKMKITKDDLPEVWNDILPRVKKFQIAFQTTDYPANPSGLCRKHCPIDSCPYHGE
jgi:hypothetical protein